MAKLVAVVTAYNRADFVGRCVRSVLDAANPELEVSVLVMDNGSADDTAHVARQVDPDRVQVLRTEDNQHVVAVINRGFRAAFEQGGAEYIIMMNEDTQFTPGSLNRLVTACEEHPDSILTPLQLNYREPRHLDDSAYEHMLCVRPLVEDAVMGRRLAHVYPLPTIIGAAMFARREVWERVGEFDELFWFYGVDDDICTRARWLGLETLLVPEAHLFHAHGKLGVSPKQMPKAARLRKWRNELQARYLFMMKDPERSLSANLRRTAGYALKTSFQNLRCLWFAGAWQALTIYAHCFARRDAIEAARQRHFDPAKKLDR